MARDVNVSDLFNRMLADTMTHVAQRHGDQAVHRLFFELYDRTFAFLERELGFDAVLAYWDHIADNHLEELESLIRSHGFEGMARYWRATLGQEGSDYDMHVSDDRFELVVKHCPPRAWFKSRDIEHYPRYSEHFERVYRRVAQRCGYAMTYTAPDESAGTCCRLCMTKEPGDD